MPSALVNTTLSSLSSGVSQQYQEGRFDSQVSGMTNCIPSLTRGILRRNPLIAVKSLEGVGAELTDAFVYSYDRGTGTEQYIVIIPGDGSIHTYNANSGDLLYSKTGDAYLLVPEGSRAKDSFKALTLGDHTFIVNTTISPKLTDTVVPYDGYDDMAFYWIKKTIAVTVKQYQTGTNPVESGSLIQGYDYTLNNITVKGTEDTRPSPYVATSLNTGEKISAEFVGLNPTYDETNEDNDPQDTSTWTGAPVGVVNSSESLATAYEGAISYNADFTGSDWKWEDSFGNEASLGVWKTVASSDILPASLPVALKEFIVKVSGGTSAEFDDYYLKYNYDNKSWKETVAPGAKTIIDASTMPHVLYRLTGGFSFTTYQGVNSDGASLDNTSAWANREAGGIDEIEDPSFLNKSINNIFFHKNRLGFLTADSVILSRTGDYGNFFVQTLQEVLDDDPIDLAVASTDVTILRHAVPTAGQLLLFADDTQFTLTSLQESLTPNTADITALSNYTYGKGADAKAIGNRVYFANQAGRYSQLYSYRITDQGSSLTEANPMTIHLPTYIDESIRRIIGHDVLGYTFMETENYPKELTVLTSVIKGNEELQNAFHKWKFTKSIVSTHVINNDLYIVFSDGDLCKMSLEIPGSIEDISYVDNYPGTEGTTPYESSVNFSEFFYRGADGKGTVRGRYQIRTLNYTINNLSKYVTSIENKELNTLDSETMYGTSWIDTGVWDDSLIWVDINPYYTREYINDAKVTVMSNSKTVGITFKSSEVEPNKGFELATVNIEAFFHQRSARR